MILYLKYCPMSVFFRDSQLLVIFRSRWYHLQKSEMVHFVTIAIDNILFYWAMFLLWILIFCVCSLLNSSRYRLIHIVAGRCSSLQLVACFSMYYCRNCYLVQKQPPDMFYKKAVLKLLPYSQGNTQLYPVRFVKFLRTPFFTEYLRWLFLLL